VLSGAAPSSLPVELTSFTGMNDGAINILDWNTAGELNTSKFIIQRSVTGLEFEDIGEVAASGNSRSMKAYTFTDHDPYEGDNLYRLKIEDLDGSFKYSNIILL